MSVQEDLQGVKDTISRLENSIRMLVKYRFNRYYRERHRILQVELKRKFGTLISKLGKVTEAHVVRKLKELDKNLSVLLTSEISQDACNRKLRTIERLDLLWPELEIELSGSTSVSFELPSEIPKNENRLDLEEAIKDYRNGSYISALVMCRRAYEGALAAMYKLKTNAEPFERLLCLHCKAILRDKAYMGIAKLHDWAIRNGLVTSKLRQVGFLLSDMGAGAAHPPLEEFPRDGEIAKLGIDATITLLKDISKIKQP